MFTDQKLTLKLRFIIQLKGLWYNNFHLIISQVLNFNTFYACSVDTIQSYVH